MNDYCGDLREERINPADVEERRTDVTPTQLHADLVKERMQQLYGCSVVVPLHLLGTFRTFVFIIYFFTECI